MHSFGAVEGCFVSNRETRIEERVSSSPNRSCFCNCARYLKDTNSLQRLTRRVCVCVCEWSCLLDFDFDFQVGQATTKDEDKIEEMVSLVVGGNQNS